MASTYSDKLAPDAATESRLMRLLTGGWVAQVLYVVAKLGIADQLRTGPLDCDTLAAATNTDPVALRRLLRALATLGMCAEDREGRFGMTRLGELLETDSPRSLRSFAIMLGEEHYQAWGGLLYSIETGETAFDHRFKEPVFDYFATHPDASVTFHRAMTELTTRTHLAVVEAYEFAQFRKVVDVGGGRGTLIAAILRAHPRLTGVLFDLPGVRAAAREYLYAQNVADRCQVWAGDFFLSVPEGGDAYLLSTVIHDWHDEQATQILKNVYQAMPDEGKLLVIERVLGHGRGDDFATLADLNMLVMTGGLERTEEEYRELLAGAGFELTRIVETRSSSFVIEAVKG